MKKLIAGLLFAGSLFSPFAALADATPTPPVLGAADPNLMTQAWGLTGYQTPNVAQGATVTDAHGYSEVCPSWYPKQALGACQDITGTLYYQSRMNAGAQFLISFFGSRTAATKVAPSMAGWIKAQ
jgi:hypothetical protein